MKTNFVPISALFIAIGFIGATISRAETTKWISGTGDWTDAARWSDGMPDSYKHAEIHGTGTVRVPAGAFPLANLQIGKNLGDHTRVELDGGKMVEIGNHDELLAANGVYANLYRMTYEQEAAQRATEELGEDAAAVRRLQAEEATANAGD